MFCPFSGFGECYALMDVVYRHSIVTDILKVNTKLYMVKFIKSESLQEVKQGTH